MAHRLSQKEAPYGNVLVRSIDGAPMFRTTMKRANFYLKKGIGKLLAENEIQLLFEAAGPGNISDEYLMEEKKNACVKCNSEENLTKHHIVPYCFRKHFPEEIKSYASKDVVVMCWSCHANYHKAASPFLQSLYERSGIQMSPYRSKETLDLLRAKKAANAVLSGDKIPKDKVIELTKRAKELSGLESLEEIAKIETNYFLNKDSSKKLIESLSAEELSEFEKGWRKNFLEVCQPEFLPESFYKSVEI